MSNQSQRICKLSRIRGCAGARRGGPPTRTCLQELAAGASANNPSRDVLHEALQSMADDCSRDVFPGAVPSTADDRSRYVLPEAVSFTSRDEPSETVCSTAAQLATASSSESSVKSSADGPSADVLLHEHSEGPPPFRVLVMREENVHACPDVARHKGF